MLLVWFIWVITLKKNAVGFPFETIIKLKNASKFHKYKETSNTEFNSFFRRKAEIVFSCATYFSNLCFIETLFFIYSVNAVLM